MAYDAKVITLHAKIKVRREIEFEGEKVKGLIDIFEQTENFKKYRMNPEG